MLIDLSETIRDNNCLSEVLVYWSFVRKMSIYNMRNNQIYNKYKFQFLTKF